MECLETLRGAGQLFITVAALVDGGFDVRRFHLNVLGGASPSRQKNIEHGLLMSLVLELSYLSELAGEILRNDFLKRFFIQRTGPLKRF